MRQQWMRLVRSKLVPLKLLIPVGPNIHEWSRTYRDMIFEMALFVARHGDEVSPQVIRSFIGRWPRTDIVASFSESEIGVLMRKSVEYNLPVSSPRHLVGRAIQGSLPTREAPLAI
jgi:hypothetical protein